MVLLSTFYVYINSGKRNGAKKERVIIRLKFIRWKKTLNITTEDLLSECARVSLTPNTYNAIYIFCEM